MWPEHVVCHAQDALRAARTRSHPEWHIAEQDAMTRFAIRMYIDEAHDTRSLGGDDFEFSILMNLSKPMRWFSVRFDDTPEV